ncbi:hypothetical protein HDU93_006472, partial [Gonapodya sp. JEL0774]
MAHRPDLVFPILSCLRNLYPDTLNADLSIPTALPGHNGGLRGDDFKLGQLLLEHTPFVGINKITKVVETLGLDKEEKWMQQAWLYVWSIFESKMAEES